MKVEYQSQIAKYWNMSHKFLGSALDIMRMFRNACAHNEIVYNYKTVGFHLRAKEITHLYTHFNIPFIKEKNKFEKGTNDLLALAFIFKTMLPKNQFKEFIDQYKSILNKLNSRTLARIINTLTVPKDIETIKSL